jgi:hypothetical protein
MHVEMAAINPQAWHPGLGSTGSTLSAADQVGALAGSLVGILEKVFSGCGQTCVETSQEANALEPYLQQNLQAYLSSSRTASEQALALSNFDTIWSKLAQFCGSGQFGTAGQKCISDRQQGSCAYKTSPGGWNGCTYSAPGPNNSGQTCWNWFVGYRDPIANDPCVVPDSVGSTSLASALNTSSATLPLLLAALFLVVDLIL